MQLRDSGVSWCFRRQNLLRFRGEHDLAVSSGISHLFMNRKDYKTRHSREHFLFRDKRSSCVYMYTKSALSSAQVLLKMSEILRLFINVFVDEKMCEAHLEHPVLRLAVFVFYKVC